MADGTARNNKPRKRNGASRSATPPGNGSRGPRPGGGGNPQQSFDRYVALARSAATSGDRVEAENYYQHAEHYFRLMNRTAG